MRSITCTAPNRADPRYRCRVCTAVRFGAPHGLRHSRFPVMCRSYSRDCPCRSRFRQARGPNPGEHCPSGQLLLAVCVHSFRDCVLPVAQERWVALHEPSELGVGLGAQGREVVPDRCRRPGAGLSAGHTNEPATLTWRGDDVPDGFAWVAVGNRPDGLALTMVNPKNSSGLGFICTGLGNRGSQPGAQARSPVGVKSAKAWPGGRAISTVPLSRARLVGGWVIGSGSLIVWLG